MKASSLATLAVAALAMVAASPALAQSSSPAPERHDVRKVCDGINSALHESIDSIWTREEPVGEMQVRFTLRGGRVSEVRTEGMADGYYGDTRSAVRRAVRALSCRSDTQDAQQFTFRIRFRSPEDAAALGDEQLALLER
jgi:hypothetical protein